MVFVMDNGPKHSAKKTKVWIEENIEGKGWSGLFRALTSIQLRIFSDGLKMNFQSESKESYIAKRRTVKIFKNLFGRVLTVIF